MYKYLAGGITLFAVMTPWWWETRSGTFIGDTYIRPLSENGGFLVLIIGAIFVVTSIFIHRLRIIFLVVGTAVIAIVLDGPRTSFLIGCALLPLAWTVDYVVRLNWGRNDKIYQNDYDVFNSLTGSQGKKTDLEKTKTKEF